MSNPHAVGAWVILACNNVVDDFVAWVENFGVYMNSGSFVDVGRPGFGHNTGGLSNE